MNETVTEMNVCREKGSFANGINDREACPKFWIAALVQMNCEKKIAIRLKKLGYECYVPIQIEMRQWSDRKKRIERIVIPMVVFILIDESQEKTIRDSSFIHKFVSYPETTNAAIIPSIQIERLKALLKNAESTVSFSSDTFHIGDRVIIMQGLLKGLTGPVIQKNGESLFILKIELLGCAKLIIDKSILSMVS